MNIPLVSTAVLNKMGYSCLGLRSLRRSKTDITYFSSFLSESKQVIISIAISFPFENTAASLNAIFAISKIFSIIKFAKCPSSCRSFLNIKILLSNLSLCLILTYLTQLHTFSLILSKSFHILYFCTLFIILITNL